MYFKLFAKFLENLPYTRPFIQMLRSYLYDKKRKHFAFSL